MWKVLHTASTARADCKLIRSSLNGIRTVSVRGARAKLPTLGLASSCPTEPTL